MKRSAVITVLTILLLSSAQGIFVLPGQEATGQVIPGPSIICNPGIITLEGTEGKNPTANFSCQITNPTAHEVVFLVNFSAPGLWTIPSQVNITLDAGNDTSFTVYVTLTPMSSVRGSRTILSCSKMIRQDGAPPAVPYISYSSVQVVVTGKQIFQMEHPQPFTMTAGKDKELSIKVWNLGFQREMVKLVFPNKENLKDQGFKFSPVTLGQTIDPGSFAVWNMTVTSPEAIYPDEIYILTLQANTSNGAHGMDSGKVLILVESESVPLSYQLSALILILGLLGVDHYIWRRIRIQGHWQKVRIKL